MRSIVEFSIRDRRHRDVAGLEPSEPCQDFPGPVFGNINAIVSGLAFFRNKLGDAHGQCEKKELLLNELGELSVNLAGSICIFLINAFEKKKDRAKTIHNKV